MAPVTAELIDQYCSEVKPLKLKNKWKAEQIEKMLERFKLDGKSMLKMAEVYRKEMELGLADKPSSLQMENTYIPELPNGTEEGQYLALDLGGTNFRVILVDLEKGKIVNEKVKHYHISDELRLNCGIKLFDYLAECISEFVKDSGLADRVLPMGFTFSFPMHQHALDSGILKVWTKSFACPGVEGKDVVKLLNEAIHRRQDNHVELICVLNDTTGTLMQGALLDKNVAIAMIIGTGTNGCYLERAERVQHWEVEKHGEKQVVIDIEWGAFGDNGCIDFVKTDYDRTVDEKSLIPTSFTFEKKIGGKYMGELVQVVMCSLTREGHLFNGVPSENLLQHGLFRTSYVSGIEEDSINGTMANTEKVLEDLGLDHDDDDIKVVQYICHLVSLRAAQLVAVCVSEVLIRIDKPNVTIAVDGSLFKFHPRLRIWTEKYIKLLAPNHPFKFVLVQDGSGKGAALTSAIAKRITEKY